VRWSPARPRIWRRHAHASGRLVLEVAGLAGRNGPGPDHRPRRAGQGAGADQSLATGLPGRLFSVVVLLLALATLCSGWQWGTKVWPRCWAAAPQGHGAWAGMRARAWPVVLFHWRFNWRLPCSWCLPVLLGPGHAHRHHRGSGLAARSAAVPRGDADRVASRLQYRCCSTNRTHHHRAGRVDRRGSWRRIWIRYASRQGRPEFEPGTVLQVAAQHWSNTLAPGTALLEEALAASYRCWRWRPADLCGAGVQGQIGGFDGVCRVRARLDGWRGWA